MDEKITHFAVHFSPSIFGFKKISSLHSAPNQKCSGLFNFILLPMLMEKHSPPFYQFFFVPTQENIDLFVDLSFFLFVLVHTRVIRASNYYIFIYNMKEHYFNWTSYLNCLIGLLSSFKV